MGGLATVAIALAAAASAASAKDTNVPAGNIAVPLIRDAEQSAYLAELTVGSPPQTVLLKADTGSPTYSFVDSRNEVCARPGRPCEAYGSFDNSTSTTSFYEGTGFHNALSNHGLGDYLNDTVSIGGVSTEHMYFGYVTRFGFPDRVLDPVTSILGLSLDCAIAGPQCTDQGPYLIPQLKKASQIDHMVSSIYLGPDDANTTSAEMILGGAYDEAKIGGELFTFDMVDPFDQRLSIGQTNSINVTALDVVVDGSEAASDSYGEPEVGLPVLMDTGVASWYLPGPIAEAIFEGLGGLLDGDFNPGSPYQDVDCRARDAEFAKGHVVVHFGAGRKIEVPLHTLVTRFSEDHCVTYVNARGDTPFIFGDPFLRGVYSIFDQENWTITLSEVKHTSERRIVPMPEGGFKA